MFIYTVHCVVVAVVCWNEDNDLKLNQTSSIAPDLSICQAARFYDCHEQKLVNPKDDFFGAGIQNVNIRKPEIQYLVH